MQKRDSPSVRDALTGRRADVSGRQMYARVRRRREVIAPMSTASQASRVSPGWTDKTVPSKMLSLLGARRARIAKRVQADDASAYEAGCPSRGSSRRILPLRSDQPRSQGMAHTNGVAVLLTVHAEASTAITGTFHHFVRRTSVLDQGLSVARGVAVPLSNDPPVKPIRTSTNRWAVVGEGRYGRDPLPCRIGTLIAVMVALMHGLLRRSQPKLYFGDCLDVMRVWISSDESLT